MRRLLTAIVLMGAAFRAVADEPAAPGLYRVANVETRLNVRAEPRVDSPVIGALARDAINIEVVETDPGSQWGRINLGEGPGWASLDFLTPQEEMWAANALPASLRCFGTEPFWDVRRDGEDLVRNGLDEPERALKVTQVTGTAGSASRVVIARDDKGSLMLGIAPEQCSDGMSDRVFGLGARMSEGDAPALIGCCSVVPH